MPRQKMIICGSIAIDRIMSFDGLYKDTFDTKNTDSFSISMLLEKMAVSRGGTGANIAYNLAKLGEKPILLGSVGDDAKEYIKFLEETGVDISNVHFSKLPTASFNVINDSADNQIAGFYPGAMSDSASLKIDNYKDQNVLVTVASHDPITMRAQVDECRKHNIKLFYDVGQQVSNVPKEHLTEGIQAAEIIIVNDYEISVLCQKTGFSEKEIEKKTPILIITYGANGSIIKGSKLKHQLKVKAARPAVVQEPTGAGDAYRAGFLYGYSRDWDLALCGQLGSTVASFAVEKYGSQVSYNISDIKERYKINFSGEVDINE